MIINRLSQKYKCGCERGVSEYKRSNILAFLNSVIEWPWSSDHNPDSPKDTIIPGDVLEFQSVTGTKTICAVDSEDRLVQIVSETGPFALKRFCEEFVIPEYELSTQDTSSLDKISWELVENDSILQDPKLELFNFPDYIKFRIIQDRIIPKDLQCRHFIYRFKFSHDLMFGIESEILVTNKCIYYLEDNIISPDSLSDCWEDILGYLYQHVDRVPRPSINWEDEMEVAEFISNYSEILSKMSRDERENFVFKEGIQDENIKKMILDLIFPEKEMISLE